MWLLNIYSTLLRRLSIRFWNQAQVNLLPLSNKGIKEVISWMLGDKAELAVSVPVHPQGGWGWGHEVMKMLSDVEAILIHIQHIPWVWLQKQQRQFSLDSTKWGDIAFLHQTKPNHIVYWHFISIFKVRSVDFESMDLQQYVILSLRAVMAAENIDQEPSHVFKLERGQQFLQRSLL